MTTLDSTKLPIVKRTLYIPPLQEIVDVLNKALPSNFAEVTVDIVDCPDLTQQPFTLAEPGLGGSPKLLEIGGPPYLMPLVNRDKVYDIKTIIERVDHNGQAFVIGAGAGPWPLVNTNCEMTMNLSISSSELKNETRLTLINTADKELCIHRTVPTNETRFALLANLFVTEGKPGKVIRVHAKKRIGKDDFIASIRKALSARYTEQLVGLGGTFLLKEGKAKQHVMPDFSTTSLESDEALNNWLYFYDMSAPLIAVGTLVTAETDLDLRVQHFHDFSHHGEGGHYHYDTTPDTVEYLGYFNVGEAIYRIDKPPFAQGYGKD